jgi:uncharacterized protein YndB with AHSA1/START domain
MAERSVTHSTFVIERSFKAAPARVFAAFADLEQKRQWFAEGDDWQPQEFQMDFRVGGAERARGLLKEGNPFAGTAITNNTSYLEIVGDKRIVFAYTMTLGYYCMSASLVTIELLPAGKGTELIFTHQGAYFEGADGPEMREEGWGKLLDRLGASLAK